MRMLNVLRCIGPALLFAAASQLALSWDRIPLRWVAHWDAAGVPDGFARRTPGDVFGPLLAGLLIWALLEAISIAITRTARIPEVAQATAASLRLLALGIAAMFAVVAAALPLVQPARPLLLIACMVALTFGLFALGLWHLAREVSRLKRAGRRELHGWNGIVYRNPDDDRLWVPNVAGYGYTLNFAKPQAWLVLGVLLLPGVVLTTLSLAL